jgi:hypothetical protein
MWTWFKRWRQVNQRPVETAGLRGAPRHVRTKTYSAQTGYVYQYVFKGYYEPADKSSREYRFLVTRDRTSAFTISVCVTSQALEDCSKIVHRPVLDAERYAIAKLALFHAFDDLEGVEELTARKTPAGNVMAAYLSELNRV